MFSEEKSQSILFEDSMITFKEADLIKEKESEELDLEDSKEGLK